VTQKTSYAGKYFSILGDSISTLDGYNPMECAVFYDWQNKCAADIFAPEDTWWGRVIQALGGKLLVNHAYSGSTVSRHPVFEVESYGCSDTRTGALGLYGQQPDVIMILLGLNDWGWGIPIAPAKEKEGLFCFSGAYEAMLSKLRRNYPEAQIWCMTLPRSVWSRNPEAHLPLVHSGGHLRDYSQAIVECARKIGCRCLDIDLPGQPYDTIDGYHPNAAGMQTIADAVLLQLREGDAL
jgi:lysophospholipase L1-like esterase